MANFDKNLEISWENTLYPPGNFLVTYFPVFLPGNVLLYLKGYCNQIQCIQLFECNSRCRIDICNKMFKNGPAFGIFSPCFFLFTEQHCLRQPFTVFVKPLNALCASFWELYQFLCIFEFWKKLSSKAYICLYWDGSQ